MFQDIANKTELISQVEMFLVATVPLSVQVTVTAVAMTFDKDQTQEKTADKPPTKGLSGYRRLSFWGILFSAYPKSESL